MTCGFFLQHRQNQKVRRPNAGPLGQTENRALTSIYMSTLWHGRFADGPSAALTALNNSLAYDRRLYREDIQGSLAHVEGLVAAGLLTTLEGAQLRDALREALGLLERDEVTFSETDEDIHTVVERLVTEIAGEVGGKLHMGRSRNDQSTTDTRLFVKREMRVIIELVLKLQNTLYLLAEQNCDVYLPGYTHLQRAQPVRLAHHFMAHAWAFARDVDRLHDVFRRTDVSPLGAGALAGSSLPLDVVANAERLGFARVFDNSMDAVSDRDYVAESLFAISLLGLHLSRIGEEMIVWSSEEFGFVSLDDGYATGSSMMPQKKNPDIAELARGKSGRLIGNLTGFLAASKGIPLTYNKDLQEDKEALFDSVDQIKLLLIACNGMLGTATYHADVMRHAADNSASGATDLAEWLVVRGVPFRHAHAVVGDLVRRSMIGEGTLQTLTAQHELLGPDAAGLLDPGVSVDRRSTHGGGGREPVAEELRRLREQIARDTARASGIEVAFTD